MVRQFAIVPGASTGIGYEFARICAREGFDLLVAADEVEIEKAAADLRREPGAEVVEARHLDLAKQEDIDKLHAAIRGRPIDVLTANLRRVVHRLKAAGRRAGNRGLSEFTVVCASRGASRFRNQRDLPHAGRDRDRVFQARRHARHQGGLRGQRRSCHGRAPGLRRHGERRVRCCPVCSGKCDARGDARKTAS